MAAHIGLYFPYFHFPNDAWVKAAALYWDKMYRIVPGNYMALRDTMTVKELSGGERSFIGQLDPADFYRDLFDIRTAFVKLIETHTDELVKQFGIENRASWPINAYTAEHAPDANPKLAYIYNQKIEKELRDLLIKRGLGTNRSDIGPDYDWVGMHPKLANIYMAALAERLARHIPTHPVTEDQINYFAVSGFTFERLTDVLLEDFPISSGKLSNDEVEAKLATISILAVMPKDIDNVPVEKILDIREKYSGEFGKFQEFVQAIVAELPNLSDTDVSSFVIDHLEAEYKKKIKPKLDDLDQSIKSIGFETIPTVINMDVQVPTILAAAITAGAVKPVFGATAAVAIGLLSIIGDKRKAAQAELSRSDVAYLFRLRNDLTPFGSLEWIKARAQKYLFNV